MMKKRTSAKGKKRPKAHIFITVFKHDRDSNRVTFDCHGAPRDLIAALHTLYGEEDRFKFLVDALMEFVRRVDTSPPGMEIS